MKISIIFKNISDKKSIEFDTEQLAKNFVRILKAEQKNSPDLGLLDILSRRFKWIYRECLRQRMR